jgi:hypothetical protein
MNISWSDLNNVEEAGDYPFRNGTIAVTFAEIAVWRNSPGAQFHLLRKHPLQGEPRYVLGEQVDERLIPDQLIYESSNGDAWLLTLNPATGTRAVMHRPNEQSSGQTSYIDTDNFLSEGANGPEHQALRRLVEPSAPTATMLIAYDVHPPKGDAYEKLAEAIQSLGGWWHHLETIWIVRCAQTPAEIRDRLKSHLGTDDQLLVVDISGDVAGWVGVNEPGSKWLAQNI